MKFSPSLRFSPLRRAGRVVSIAALALLVLLGALYAAARFYWPTMVTRDVDLAGEIARRAGRPVHVGRIEPYWDGIHPGVRIVDATVYADDGRTPAVHMDEVRASLSLWSLLRGQLDLHGLALVHPVVTLTRDADGRIGVAGFAPTDAPAAGGAAWLLAQPRLAVEAGELQWIDAREPKQRLALSKFDLQLRNSGDRHALTASAAFPPAICRQCSVAFDIAGNPFHTPWNGKISLRAEALDAAALPLVLRERLPQPLRGRFDAELAADWRDGLPVRVRGQASVAALYAVLDAQRPPLAVRELAGEVDWRRTGEGWRLDLSDLKLGLARPAWYAGRLRAIRTDDEIRFEAQRVELDDLTAFVAAYRGEHPMLERWTALHPSGVLQNFDARLPDPPSPSGAFSVSADLLGVSVAANERLPGLRGLSGHIEFDEKSGEIDLDAKDFALDLRTVFRAPLEARHISGRLSWERTENAWRVLGSDLRLAGDDGSGSGRLRVDIPLDTTLSPVLQLRVDFRDGVGAHAARYYPVHHLPPRTLEWMEYAFMSGHIVSGHLIYEGPIREWPFENGQGRFEIQGHVRNAAYRYLRGWKPLTQAEADVSIKGADVLVTGHGRIGTLTARNIRVELRRADDGVRTVGVHGRVEGPIAETLRVLRAVEAPEPLAWQSYLAHVTRAEGNSAIDLDVRLPLKHELGPSYQVAYRFSNAGFRLGDTDGLDGANGIVRFTESGLRDSAMQGQLFGGPIILASVYDANGLRVQGEGQFVLAELLRTRRPFAERVSGNVAWSFGWQSGSAGPQLRAEANFAAVRSRLPAPFNRTDSGSPAKLTLVTEQSRPDALVLALGGTVVSGKAALARDGNAWRLQKGRVDFGRSGAALPLRDGLEIGVAYEALDLDRWLPLLGESGGGDAVVPEVVTGFNADIKRLRLAGRDWGRVLLNAARRGPEWRAVVDGDALAGEGRIMTAPKAPTRIRLDLAFLRLPERVGDDPQDKANTNTDPRNLPALDLRALSFEYKSRKFGQLDFSAAPFDSGWNVSRADLKRPEGTLAVHGVWRVNGPRHTTDVTLALDSDNMGTTLDAWGVGGQMAEGKVRLRTHLAWPGTPLRPTLAGLDGRVEVSAEKGRFLRFDPGAVRLFGLLDLRSIGRYFTLDFSSAFGKGFFFDAIHGNIDIERGNARTNDLLVKGPALSLGVNGRVGLAAEDFDLVLEASPRFGSTLAVTSFGLLGPQAAAAILALQRLFKRQIEAGTRVTYIVKGPWANPNVTKLGKSQPPKTEEPPVPASGP